MEWMEIVNNNAIRHSIFFYDGRITSDTKCQAEKERTIVYDVLKMSGWIIEQQQSDQEGNASQCKEYLGFIIDTDNMTVRISEAKKQHIAQQVLETIAHGPKPIMAK
jgi:siderophore synthetase component